MSQINEDWNWFANICLIVQICKANAVAWNTLDQWGRTWLGAPSSDTEACGCLLGGAEARFPFPAAPNHHCTFPRAQEGRRSRASQVRPLAYLHSPWFPLPSSFSNLIRLRNSLWANGMSFSLSLSVSIELVELSVLLVYLFIKGVQVWLLSNSPTRATVPPVWTTDRGGFGPEDNSFLVPFPTLGTWPQTLF